MLGALTINQNFSTGNAILPKSALLPSVPEADVQPMSPMESVATMFADMRDSLFAIAENTLKTNELLETAVLGTPQQQRDADISAEDRDPSLDKPDDEEEGPGFLGRLGQTTKGFFGTLLGKGVLAGLALLATYVFEDEIVTGLGNFMKFFGEDFAPKIKDLYEDVSLWWDKTWEGVKTFFAFIKGIFGQLRDYVMQFDTQGAVGPAGKPIGDGLLDETELANMFKDLKAKLVEPIVEAVYDIARLTADAIIAGLGLITVSSILSRLSPFVAGGDPKKNKSKKTSRLGRFLKIGGLSRFGIAALGGIVLAGLFSFASDAAYAIEQSLSEQLPNKDDIDNELKDKGPGKINKLLSAFVAGPDSGSTFVNILSNAFNKGLMGAALGTASFIPFGTLAGFIGGSIFGALGAYFGEDEVSKAISNMFDDDTPLMMVVNYIEDMYKTLILTPFEFLFGKIGVGQDSLFSKMMIKLGADYSPKEAPETFLGLGMADKEKLYGENINPENIKHLSTEELLQMQAALLDDKSKLERSKAIFGYRFGDGYMDTHEKRKIFSELKAIEEVLEGRDITADAPDHLQTGSIIKQDMSSFISTDTLKDIQNRALLESQLGNMITVDQKKINSDNAKVDNNYYANQNPYPFLSFNSLNSAYNN